MIQGELLGEAAWEHRGGEEESRVSSETGLRILGIFVTSFSS